MGERGADLQGVLDGEVDRGDEGHAGLRAGLAALDTRWVGLQCQGAQNITTRELGLARHQTQRGTSVLFSFELKVLSFGGFGPSHCFLGEGCARALVLKILIVLSSTATNRRLLCGRVTKPPELSEPPHSPQHSDACACARKQTNKGSEDTTDRVFQQRHVEFERDIVGGRDLVLPRPAAFATGERI